MRSTDTATGNAGELTRGVGAWGAIAVNVANMIGTGVFLKTRVMTCNVGDPKTGLAVWLVAGLLSLAGTFSYGELAAMMPEAGGDYIYLRRAYGRLVGFLYGWMAFAVARAGSQAALAVGFAIFMNVALNGAALAGEVRQPQRNLPRAFVGGIVVVAALYLFVNLAYYYALTPAEIASVPVNSSVATEVLKRFLGPLAVSLTAVALMVSSFGSLHASVLANSRIPFAMARDGLFFRGLGKLSRGSNVPARAIIAQAVWGSVLALSGSYDALTDSVIFASWLFYGLTTASLFVFRRKLPDVPRPYRAVGYPVIPVLFILVTAALLVNTFMAAPREAFRGVAILLAGLPFYWYWSRVRR